MKIRNNKSIPTEFADPKIIEHLILKKDLMSMEAQDRVAYVTALCKSLNLNPLTKPFQIIRFRDGKEILYATKDCTEQLRKINGVSVIKLEKLFQDDGLYIVTVYVQDKNGRQDAATGAVNITGLTGDALANAIMKGESKAKRRATLSICGLGMIDESETDTIGDHQKIDVAEGKIIEEKDQSKKLNTSEQKQSHLSSSTTHQTLKQIADFLKAKGYNDAGKMIDVISTLLERPITSSHDLTFDDLIVIKDALPDIPNYSDLQDY